VKSATRRTVEWLTASHAAAHLGYVKEDGTPNLSAFYVFLHRERKRTDSRLRTHWLRGRMRFRRVDLDACLEEQPRVESRGSLRLMRGAR